METRPTSESCKTALAAIKSRNFLKWQGLPETCTYTDIDSITERMTDGYALRKLGRLRRETTGRMHLSEGYKTGIRIFFSHNELKLIELQYPSLPHESSELIQEIGQPAARIDYHLDIWRISQGALIYPEKGITLFVDGPEEIIMKIAVYHPCSLNHYLDELHYDIELKELEP